ncbi:Hsp20/alpha crystallin family protein [Aneurinibacillus sp. UBA3580]|uniref:Hsp20/alpha crystallin family protein n=1 Tax=Aneurinibacillus sp. UBA3580 TaxID=1946041 RepID=UPI00257F84B3|nr:Hsp20/alpha crystallin family protein [Aneurinibacillus sp. UBA3580]
MALIPYEPFRQLDNVIREFDRFFTAGWTAFDKQNFGISCVNVYETENEVVAVFDTPGLKKKEDVEIDVNNNVLSVSGSLDMFNEIKGKQMYRQERFIGRFQRSVLLPSPVSAEEIRASYKNGMLEVHMPKIKNNANKKDDIEFHEGIYIHIVEFRIC